MTAIDDTASGTGSTPESPDRPAPAVPATPVPAAPESAAPPLQPVPPKIEVSIARDEMSALIVITPQHELSTELSTDDLSTALAKAGVTHGIVRHALLEAVASFTREKARIDCHAARGLAPRNGVDGHVEFLFDTRSSHTPKENPDGTVDYREVNIFLPVGSGHELARLHPPSKGVPGKTVTGRNLACKDGRPAGLPVGPNTGPAQGDPAVLVALKDGVVRYNGSTVEVHEGFTVEGDVDFSTGNITYDKSVLVTGDVKPGFRIECGGDLQVNGLIEDCTIHVGGNVLCKQGFIGQGKGVLEAQGDVNLGFVLNQTVRSRGSINVAREAINSRLYSQGTIAVHGNPLSAVGGILLARETITLSTAGNLTGTTTHLEVGSDFSLNEELLRNEDEERALRAKHFAYSELLNKYRRFSVIRKHQTVDEKLLVSKVAMALEQLGQRIDAVLKRREEIRSMLYEEEKASIHIEHAAFPGTTFVIGAQHYLVEAELIGPKTVWLSKGSIGIG